MTVQLVVMAVLLGAGLAMDAFSVSLANGMTEQNMKAGRMLAIAGTFAGFQFAMPVIGWFFVHYAEEKLEWFGPLVPWIALGLLLYIGGKMIRDGVRENRETETAEAAGAESEQILSAGDLVMQGIATSIDALSVGFTISTYPPVHALLSSVIIGAVTFVICIVGLRIGRRLGTLLAGKASILGGVILIGIGLEIWIRGVFM